MKQNLDEYLDGKDYLGHPIGKDGFTKFFREENKEYYFAYIEDGEVIFRSEGYTAESGRDKGIASVKKNGQIEKRYKLIEMGKGKWGLSLRAGNHKEIAITCPRDSEAAAWALLPDKRAQAKRALRTAVKKNNKITDEYLPYKAYGGHERTKASPDFSTFEKEGQYYFAMLDSDDSVILRSEGYATESSRNKGIESVKKNGQIDKRYKLLELADGKWGLSLRAGNHKEIAITCPQHTEAAAWALLPSKRTEAKRALKTAAIKIKKVADEYLSCDLYKNHKRTKAYPDFSTFNHKEESYFAMLGTDDSVILRSEGYTSEKGRDNGIQSVIKNRSIEGRYKVMEADGQYFACLKAGNHQEIGRSCAYAEKAAAWASTKIWIPKPALAKEAPKSKGKDDDYLVCDAYKGHQRSVTYPDFSTFDAADLYYFAMLDKDGNVSLRSEGYTTVTARNNGIRSVIKNKDIEKRRSVIERFDHYFVILKAGNHQEIARSCALEDKAAALGLFGLIPIVAAPIAATARGMTDTEKPANSVPEDKEDDYLACEEYKGHLVNDKINNVALFKFADGQYYFALYDKNGEVKLRSEGFGRIEDRGKELLVALRFYDQPEMYERIQRGKYYIDVLKDKTGREVGRTCMKKEKVAAIIPPVVPMVPVVGAAVGAAAIITPDPVIPPDPTPVLVAPVIAPAVAGDGCMNWKWLILALLLLLLLMWLFRGCLGCAGDTVPIPPVGEVETTTETNTAATRGTITETTTAEPSSPAVGNSGGLDPEAVAAAEKAAKEALAKSEAETAAIKAAAEPKYDLESIYYDYNKWDLREEAIIELDKMVSTLESDETLQGEFLGHTDTRGATKLNDRLSRKRAQTALDYVAGQGISKSRLSWRKFSEENPKAKNDTESEQKLQLNRRVDLRILRNGKVVEDTETEVRSLK